MNKEIIMKLTIGSNIYELNEIQVKELILKLKTDNETLQSQLDIANKKLEEINEIVSSYGIQTIPSGLGECPVEVSTYELNNIYKLSIIGGE